MISREGTVRIEAKDSVVSIWYKTNKQRLKKLALAVYLGCLMASLVMGGMAIFTDIKSYSKLVLISFVLWLPAITYVVYDVFDMIYYYYMSYKVLTKLPLSRTEMNSLDIINIADYSLVVLCQLLFFDFKHRHSTSYKDSSISIIPNYLLKNISNSLMSERVVEEGKESQLDVLTKFSSGLYKTDYLIKLIANLYFEGLRVNDDCMKKCQLMLVQKHMDLDIEAEINRLYAVFKS